MLKNLSIRHFRGIEQLRLDGLQRINLLVGKNNSGKTSIMEAIFLLGGATNPLLPLTIGQLRGQRTGREHPDSTWRCLFYSMDPRLPIELEAKKLDEPLPRKLRIESVCTPRDEDEDVALGVASSDVDMIISGLRLHYTDSTDREYVTKAKFDRNTRYIEAPTTERDDFVRTTFLSARAYSSLERDARQFSHLVKIRQEEEVVEALRAIEPRIQRIDVVTEFGGSSVYVDIGLPALIPLAACGEGFVRFFSIVVELTGCRHGMLLIDEIDNGLHYSVMEQLWRLLGNLSEKHEVQIVGTTHNEELITSALEAFDAQPNEIGLFRVDRRDGQHSIATYNANAQRAVREQHFEIRG